MAWTDVRGHDDARQQLLTAVGRGRLGHAYLFVGPAGVGKHRFAVEFAKAVLCESPPAAFTACDRCPACAQVSAGTHPDFATFAKLDDKQEFTVDVARDVVGSLGLRPVRGKGKVCVIDDGDDLNEEAANTLLKTLEEPPAGSVLILLATSTDTQLPTILSRCQVLHFHPLSAADLKLALIDQGITDPAELAQLVSVGGGSVGLAVALADPAVAAFRSAFLNALGANRPDAFAVAKLMNEFVAAAGKESKDRRERAGVVVRMGLDVLRAGLRAAVGGVLPAGPERAAAERWALAGAERVADALDAATDADRGIDRRAQLEVLLDGFADVLTRR